MLFIDPIAKMPHAIYTGANSLEWDDDIIYLDTGEAVKDAQVYDENGNMIDIARPMQLFTRWYGFSFTFPDCEIVKK